ncbi:MAG: precorrin-2 C(20)-methyltransferase [Thermodesulfobacteriaceae bacterium]|nr:precorrin-2 C(20)-methyltransferase [Thermodesulfobacteriaceae bacterium]MCX8041719.1 precorrin-2 C(20)-methyltransferase [Thermodesulfobacteriaceae bacterium]MDW8136007.1 precorrin-2 C(20)-methyltransferase [Thermodesulfobacterium sp.]
MKLFVLGVGPGDPELLTLKAKKILEKVSLIFSPTGGKDHLALSIVEKLIDVRDKRVINLYFPMKKTKEESLEAHWKQLSEKVVEELKIFKEGAFITLGDPSFYSTFFYLYPYLKSLVEVKLIPGVSSVSAVACAIPLSLSIADEKIAILPANYLTKEEAKNYLTYFETLVLMKPHKSWSEILNLLSELPKVKTFYVKKATFPEEEIYQNLCEVEETSLDYFSIVIVKREKEEDGT